MMVRLLVACSLLFGCAQGVDAPLAPVDSAPDASVAAPSSAAPGSSGAALVAAPADAMKRLRHSLTHSARNVRVERRSGRLHIDMAGTFQTATVISFDANGQPSQRCLDSAADLDRMMGDTP